jgi:hypothetical protein
MPTPDDPTQTDADHTDRSEPPPDESEAHSRPEHPDLPFGDDPQSRQGDDVGSGGS